MEQKIDINRMVRYVDEHGVVAPAVVTAVHGDTVSLFVMKEHTTHHVQGIAQSDSSEKLPRTWHWPPRS